MTHNQKIEKQWDMWAQQGMNICSGYLYLVSCNLFESTST